jgi:stress-induced morphogen
VAVTDTLEELLRRAFPDASELSVVDRTGTGDHFQVIVASDRFTGLSLVEQHRLVYDALAEPLRDGTIHELRIKTGAPARAREPADIGGSTT